MASELVVGVVVIALYGRLFQSAVHSLDLAIGPWMVWLGQPVLDAVSAADLIEAVHTPARRRPLAVLGQLGELDTVIGQHGVGEVRASGDKRFQEGAGRGSIGFRVQLGEGVFGRSIDGHEEVQLAFFGPHLGDIDVEEADRVDFEGLLARPVALNLGQAADPVALQKPVQRRAGQVWNCGLQAIQAVVQWQERVPAKSEDDRLLSAVSTVERGVFGPMGASCTKARFLHLATVLAFNPC